MSLSRVKPAYPGFNRLKLSRADQFQLAKIRRRNMKKYFFKKTVNIANSKTEIQKRALLNLPSNYRLDKKNYFIISQMLKNRW